MEECEEEDILNLMASKAVGEIEKFFLLVHLASNDCSGKWQLGDVAMGVGFEF